MEKTMENAENAKTKEKEKTIIKSTRARPSAISLFEKLADDFNLTQVELYDICVNAGQAVLLKSKIPGRGDEIDALENALKQIRKIYLSSIEMAILAKSNAEKDFKLELDTKTRTISDLQEKQDEMKAQFEEMKNEMNSRIEELEQENKILLGEKARLENDVKTLNASIADKEALLQAMKNSAAAADVAASVEELKKVIASMAKNPDTADPEPDPEKNKKE